MGMDISAYSRIRKLDEAPSDNVKTFFLYPACFDNAKSEHVAGLEPGAHYAFCEEYFFYGVNYRGFYDWLQRFLPAVAEYGAARQRWENFHNDWRRLPEAESKRLWLEDMERLPFHELLYCVNAVSLLNTRICQNLAADFAELEPRAWELVSPESWEGRLYSNMRQALETAAIGGLLMMD